MNLSEVLVEHPVLFIENLLKLGIGDEGRLLYLRNAITLGKNIHDSDKKFLKKMQYAFDKARDLKSEKPFEDLKSKNFQDSNSEIQKIQNQINELKKSDSKLMDNLELLLISHDISFLPAIKNSNPFSYLLKDKNIELVEMLRKNF